jgi:hypothetical protein
VWRAHTHTHSIPHHFHKSTRIEHSLLLFCSFFLFILIFLLLCIGGTLWHLQKFLQYIIFELIPSIILLYLPPFFFFSISVFPLRFNLNWLNLHNVGGEGCRNEKEYLGWFVTLSSSLVGLSTLIRVQKCTKSINSGNHKIYVLHPSWQLLLLELSPTPFIPHNAQLQLVTQSHIPRLVLRHTPAGRFSTSLRKRALFINFYIVFLMTLPIL